MAGNQSGVTMAAVRTIGNGGYDRLEYGDVPIPEVRDGEVLVQVLAAGVNATEINTRLGWYSSSVDTDPEKLAGDRSEADREKSDGGWNAATPFPLIQGTDACGRVVAAGSEGDRRLVGERILVRPCIRRSGWESRDTVWMGSDFDGAFAQFVRIPASEVFPVDCDWSDVELGSIPCAYGTAENMLHRADVSKGDRVLVTGASGGVGSAAVQLAGRRGASVTAVAGRDKADAVAALGADRVITRDEDLLAALEEESITVAVDNVAGSGFPAVLRALARGGRYVTSGAIAGPRLELDARTLYLKDLTLIGCTAWEAPVFPDLIAAIEAGEIRPLVAGTFPLERIVEAQKTFMEKRHVGKFVLIPPGMTESQRSLFPGGA